MGQSPRPQAERKQLTHPPWRELRDRARCGTGMSTASERSQGPTARTTKTPKAWLTRTWHKSAVYGNIALDHAFWKGQPSASPRFERRNAHSESLAASSPYQEPRPADPLPTLPLEGLDRDAFLAATAGGRRPIVIRGFAQHSRAAKLWSQDYLRERLAGQECTVFATDEDGRRAGWDHGHRVEKMPFEEFLSRVGQEEMNISNSAEMVSACPDLVKDLELHRIYDTFTRSPKSFDELLTVGFFIASKKLGSEVHAAPGGNFFFNILGRKKWVLYDPALTAELKPVTVRPFTFALSQLNSQHSRKLLDMDPRPLARLPRYEVTLEPGDLLYNAPWWWHEVRNLSPFTVACAVRHTPPPFGPSPTLLNNPLFTALSIYPGLRSVLLGRSLWQRVTRNQTPTMDFVNALTQKLAESGLDRNNKK